MEETKKEVKEVKEVENDYYWRLLWFQAQGRKIVEVFNVLQESGIEPILIKGWAAARNYPEPCKRYSVDIDLAVDPKEFDAAVKLLFEKKVAGIDLHSGLRHLDTVDWRELYNGTELVKLGGIDVRILRPEDHLRVLCVHWLTDGGAYFERLEDIYYAVKNRPANFDWEASLNAVSRKRRKWIVCAVGLAERYYGLDLCDTPIKSEAKDIPGWIIKTLENEWKSPYRLKPLENCASDKKELWQQLKIRLSPNPIQATILTEGEFDDGSRLYYQLRSNLKRLKLAWKNRKKNPNLHVV